MRRHILDSPISYYAIFLSVRYLPAGLCYRLGRLVALIVYVLSKKDRVGLAFNLSIALNRPVDHPGIQKKTRQVFLNYGQYMVDFFLMPQLSPEKIKTIFAAITGEEILKNALSKGKGAILLSAHVGNWELGGNLLRALNYPLAVVVMAHNTATTNVLLNRLRKNRGMHVIEVNQSSFSGVEILRYLRNNGVVTLSGDRDYLGTGRPIDFLGKKVTFPVGPVALAMSSGAALIPAFVLKGTDGKYFGILEDAIPLVLEGEREEVIERNLAMTARVFETYIRRYPEQWYCPDPIAVSVKN
jgi:lauroyl/myristoyl acyltransferase